LATHLNTDPSSHVRVLCLGMLCHPEYPPSVEAFVQALADDEQRVVWMASSQLGYIGAKEAVAAIREILGHSAWRVRWHACEALYQLEAVDHQVVNTLEALAEQPERLTNDDWVVHCRKSEPEVTQEIGRGNWTTGELLHAAREPLVAQQSD